MDETTRMLRDYDWSMARPNPPAPPAPPDLSDVQAADDLYETARQALESVTAVREHAADDVKAAKERLAYWAGLEADAILALDRASREAVSMRKAAGLVLTASGYRAAS